MLRYISMSDETTDESNVKGKETNNDSTENQTDSTPAEKVRKDTEELKAENDAYDKERFRAETIRAEKKRGGRSEAGSEHLTPKDEMNKKAEEQAKEIVDAFN